MAAVSSIIAGAALAASAVSARQQYEAQKEARKDQKRATEEQRKARAEQGAANAAQAAREKRAQIREERIRRARIIQASENTGVAESSGAGGAVGGLSTTLGANLGFNIGQGQAATNISQFNQNASDFLSSAQNSINEANKWGQVGSLSTSIFSQAGGFNAFKAETQAPAPVENRPGSTYQFKVKNG